jgi:hypothetical protein
MVRARHNPEEVTMIRPNEQTQTGTVTHLVTIGGLTIPAGDVVYARKHSHGWEIRIPGTQHTADVGPHGFAALTLDDPDTHAQYVDTDL